jgi:hypothetical protein
MTSSELSQFAQELIIMRLSTLRTLINYKYLLCEDALELLEAEIIQRAKKLKRQRA